MKRSRTERALELVARLAWWAVLLWALAALCYAALAHAASSAIAQSGEDWVRITDRPCRLPSVLERAPEGTRGYYRMAYARVDGVEHDACWVLLSGGRVLLSYPDGDKGLPGDLFRSEPEGGV